MRWALVGPLHPFRGGIAHYGALLASELARNCDTEVHALNFTQLYPGILFPGKTQMDESGTPLSFDSIRRLGSYNPVSWEISARQVAAWRPDAVVCHWWHPFFGPAYGTLFRRLKRLAPDCRRLLLCHNVLPHERSAVDGLLTRYAFDPVDGFLVHSRNDGDRLLDFIPGARHVVRPHPRYDAFDGDPTAAGPDRAAIRQRLGYTADDRVPLFFGYIRAYKGLDLALRALAATEDPRQKLLVVGEFYEERAPYDTLIRELNLTDRVQVVDRYVPNEEVAEWFAAADLVLQPYHSATQSGIAQIAHAFGLPVVATAVGGLPEQIEDGKTGILTPPGDVVALAAALNRFFDEELGPEMADEITRAAERFSWSGLVEGLHELVAGVEG
ncbi:MAG: glycosyltransferase [bacterium]|nr:glycosyltransferase [bacterium]